MKNKSRPSLSEVLKGGDGTFRDNWSTTEAAGDDAPIPRGEYECHAITGELFNAKTTTPGYKITFKVLTGEHIGRLVWHDVWLSPAALPRAKRDLAKLGIKEPEQMERPLPALIRCKVHVVQREDDDGVVRNEVRRFEFVGIDEPPVNPFPPDADGKEDTDDGEDEDADPPVAPGTEIPI